VGQIFEDRKHVSKIFLKIEKCIKWSRSRENI